MRQRIPENSKIIISKWCETNLFLFKLNQNLSNNIFFKRSRLLFGFISQELILAVVILNVVCYRNRIFGYIVNFAFRNFDCLPFKTFDRFKVLSRKPVIIAIVFSYFDKFNWLFFNIDCNCINNSFAIVDRESASGSAYIRVY